MSIKISIFGYKDEYLEDSMVLCPFNMCSPRAYDLPSQRSLAQFIEPGMDLSFREGLKPKQKVVILQYLCQ